MNMCLLQNLWILEVRKGERSANDIAVVNIKKDSGKIGY